MIGGVGGGVWWGRESDGDGHANGEDGMELEGSGEGDGDGGDRVVSTGGSDDVDWRELCVNFGELPMLGLYVDQWRSTLGLPPWAEHSHRNSIHHITQYNEWIIAINSMTL